MSHRKRPLSNPDSLQPPCAQAALVRCGLSANVSPTGTTMKRSSTPCLTASPTHFPPNLRARLYDFVGCPAGGASAFEPDSRNNKRHRLRSQHAKVGWLREKLLMELGFVSG